MPTLFIPACESPPHAAIAGDRRGVSPCPRTGQTTCHDARGSPVPCAGSGQDAEHAAGVPWPEPRFVPGADFFLDSLTGLRWWNDAGAGGFPMSWREALAFIDRINQEAWGGHAHWRLPNRRELRSLVDHGRRRPALPADLPARNVFQSWYWSGTSAAIHPSHAWYVDMAGGRMFYGGKDQSFMVWPVLGDAAGLAATGQFLCHDTAGGLADCVDSGQDGAFRSGCPWPRPRFMAGVHGVLDRLTGLVWHGRGDLLGAPVCWESALERVARLNGCAPPGFTWRLPNINELESLVDCARHSPALPLAHPFPRVRDTYWSSTTSAFEPDWAWALYLDKGAVGVGHKREACFWIWPVLDRAPVPKA